MKYRFKISLAVTYAIVGLCLAGTAYGGTTVQDGDWSSATTWDTGVPGAADFASIKHVVDFTTMGQGVNSLFVGFQLGAATLNISGGDLTVTGGNLTIGTIDGPGTLNISGGALTFTGNLQVGEVDDAGTVNLSGGVLTVGGAANGSDSPDTLTISGGSFVSNGLVDWSGGTEPGIIRIEGASGSFAINGGGLNIGSAVLIVQPTGNGASGLSTINVNVGTPTLSAGSTLELDISAYTPQVGDSWDVITSPVAVSGAFGTIVAPPGYTISQEQILAKGLAPQSYRITVTATQAQLPASGSVGLAVLVVSLALAAGVYALRRRTAGGAAR